MEEIKNFTAEQVEERMAQIKNEIDNADAARLEELNAEIEALEARKGEIAMETRKANMKAVAAGAGTVISKPDTAEVRTLESVRASQEYLEAFANMIKTGSDKECRALMTDLVDGGSVPVPTIIDDFINTAWERANLTSRVRTTNIKGTAKYPFEYSSTGASVHVEGDEAPAEEQLVLGTVSVEPAMLKKWITVTDEVLALKGQAFLDYIYDEIEFKILQLADATIIGAIKNSPAAATKTAAGVRQLTVPFDFATIFAAQAELVADAQNVVAIMNKKTYFNTFMSLKDLSDRPIYNIVSDNGRPSYYINGVEVLFDNTLDEDEIIVGDLNGVIMNLPDDRNVTFVTDPYSLAEEDKVKIVGKLYAGIQVVRDGYFVVVTKGEISA